MLFVSTNELVLESKWHMGSFEGSVMVIVYGNMICFSVLILGFIYVRMRWVDST